MSGPLTPSEANDALGDFTTSTRVIPISILGVAIGAMAAFVAKGLLILIGVFTNAFFFQRWGTDMVSPAGNALGILVIAVPVLGSVLVGFMARFGSERIRGHGIPEAIEAILMNGSRVEPRVAVLKPISAAIAIGSGGPFGAEGPIIMTGGAFGSMVAQLFRLTGAERKTLLVAGAAAGMSATFASPLAAILLGVELLLFEWKPRSFLPVALASGVAQILRHWLISPKPLLPIGALPITLNTSLLAGCAVAGLLTGILSFLATRSVYAAEDAFMRLRVHWMWWPALGGIVVGIGGWLCPKALGVGYDVIDALVRGSIPPSQATQLLAAKWTMWAVALGSGTSGGVLAPILMMGGCLGVMLSVLLPAAGAPFWPLMTMGAMLGGTMRVPLTGVVFLIELTGNLDLLLPLLVSVAFAYAVSVLALSRSILTEKISRRGYHLSCEYAVDPLEILRVREVMQADFLSLPLGVDRATAGEVLARRSGARRQRLFPIVDSAGVLAGAVTAGFVERWLREPPPSRLDPAPTADAPTADALLPEYAVDSVVVAHPDEPLRVLANRMATTGRYLVPVVSRADREVVVGVVTLRDILKGRLRVLEEEYRRERVIRPEVAILRLRTQPPHPRP